jgi:hypothetical protein
LEVVVTSEENVFAELEISSAHSKEVVGYFWFVLEVLQSREDLGCSVCVAHVIKGFEEYRLIAPDVFILP